jgi:hypothetical protein
MAATPPKAQAKPSTVRKPNLNAGGAATLAALTKAQSAHGQRLDGHDSRLDGHDGRLTEHGDRITALEKQVAAKNPDLAAMDSADNPSS